MTTPETILNCSRARRFPLISFGEISDMYNGAKQLSIPTPQPPAALPTNNVHNLVEIACKNPPSRNMIQPKRIVRFLENRSARDEQVRLPQNAPSSRDEVRRPFIKGVNGKRFLK